MTERNGSTWAGRRVRARVLREETHCFLCGEWVDKTIPYRNPDGTINLMSPTTDHDEAVTLGGSLLARDNQHLTHLGGNISKGDGRLTDERRLNTTRKW